MIAEDNLQTQSSLKPPLPPQNTLVIAPENFWHIRIVAMISNLINECKSKAICGPVKK